MGAICSFFIKTKPDDLDNIDEYLPDSQCYNDIYYYQQEREQYQNTDK